MKIDNENKLPSLKELEDFIVSKDKNNCPWCGGKKWGLHVSNIGETLLTSEKIPNLRALPKIKLSVPEADKEDRILHGTVELKPDAAVVSAVAECQECGHLTFFNYFKIMQLLKEQKGEKHG